MYDEVYGYLILMMYVNCSYLCGQLKCSIPRAKLFVGWLAA